MLSVSWRFGPRAAGALAQLPHGKCMLASVASLRRHRYTACRIAGDRQSCWLSSCGVTAAIISMINAGAGIDQNALSSVDALDRRSASRRSLAAPVSPLFVGPHGELVTVRILEMKAPAAGKGEHRFDDLRTGVFEGPPPHRRQSKARRTGGGRRHHHRSLRWTWQL